MVFSILDSTGMVPYFCLSINYGLHRISSHIYLYPHTGIVSSRRASKSITGTGSWRPLSARSIYMLSPGVVDDIDSEDHDTATEVQTIIITSQNPTMIVIFTIDPISIGYLWYYFQFPGPISGFSGLVIYLPYHGPAARRYHPNAIPLAIGRGNPSQFFILHNEDTDMKIHPLYP